ncbi:CitMHS family citrate-Mg2+:H+ or citrate-Ca2+:H+ symporter [Scopulibacillus darangshiensis]|uniref:CitMHS family citrate-Mg2+:H+ or citrate-Ca2+:H+ symporter n=1 Tax=Scopulibacillus darangshiensis TaxID=442528 RepID=A0A4R2NI68_9BACL|nr:CitMHS family transporter [Scopulibacillus darangshiensis]TCP21153.1 CitMHS family citrate-Mg2+:H+ or citrate-Ca2+:H+ symporter [Scopulibacillus darangshiensis]
MLALLGFLAIIVFLYTIMTKKLSVIVALVIIPVIFALIGGFGAEIGDMMLKGIIKVAPTGVLVMFAVLYFGLMIDTGLFDPLVSRMIRLVKGDPLKIVVGTAILTMMVALDGDGTSTFMITISALLPLYKKLKMNPLVLSGVVALGAGVMNVMPWGGPTARAMSVLKVDSSVLFNPVIPALCAGILWVIIAAYLLGKKERRRLGVVTLKYEYNHHDELSEDQVSARRPKLFWFNVILTIVLIVALIMVWLPLPVLFVISFTVALFVNYPKIEEQHKRLTAYGHNVVMVTAMIFAAGIFTGILTGTGMIDAMAKALVTFIPDALGGHLPVLVAITSMPLSFVFTPDAYYFGVMPVLSEAASAFGVEPVAVGRAAILGQMTTGFPLSPLTASTFILVGMAGVNLGDHQRFIFKWAFATTIVMTIIAVITGAIPI